MQPTREAFFEILVREHELALLAFVRSVVFDSAAAEDIVQECFLAAWQSVADYDEDRPFAGWLRGIASNKILEHCRNHATDQRHVRILSPATLDALSSEFERLMPGRGDVCPDTLAALKHCLGTLSRRDHEIVERAYQQGCTCRVIAFALDQSIEWVKKRLQRARAELRDCILGQLRKEDSRG